MEIYIIDTQEVVTFEQFRQMHPNTSFPEIPTDASVADFGAAVVVEFTPPTGAPYQQVVRDGVELVDGRWQQKWVLGDVALPNLTMRQFRLGLRRAGLLSAVQAALTAMPGGDGEDARIEFEYASEVERGNVLVSGLAAALDLTDEQIDTLWVSSLAL